MGSVHPNWPLLLFMLHLVIIMLYCKGPETSEVFKRFYCAGRFWFGEIVGAWQVSPICLIQSFSLTLSNLVSKLTEIPVAQKLSFYIIKVRETGVVKVIEE